MKFHVLYLALVLSLFSFFGCATTKNQPIISELNKDNFSDLELEDQYDQDKYPKIYDPLEPINRIFFVFNDKLYFWFLKPVSIGYSSVFPEPLRVCFFRFFENIKTPIRAGNCLLQLKIVEFFKEIFRFVVNSTIGIVGFADASKDLFGIKAKDEDLGQSLGWYGIGDGFYLVIPVLGPSTLRDLIGKGGDSFLNPLSYLETTHHLLLKGTEVLNEVSLKGQEYEDLKLESFDPYLAVRNAYYEMRRAKIRD